MKEEWTKLLENAYIKYEGLRYLSG